MLRPFARLRFRLTHAAWACALALMVGTVASATPLHRLAFPAEGFGPVATWVAGRGSFASVVVFAAAAAHACPWPCAAVRAPAPLPAPVDGRPYAAPLPAALRPVPPPACA